MITGEELQKLAAIRIEDARVLLESHRYSGAYYLAGYSVECALKACVAKRGQGDFPHTHSFVRLLDEAGLTEPIKEKSNADTEFQTAWSHVKEWTVASRYAIHDEQQARDMIDSSHRVLECLKLYW